VAISIILSLPINFPSKIPPKISRSLCGFFGSYKLLELQLFDLWNTLSQLHQQALEFHLALFPLKREKEAFFWKLYNHSFLTKTSTQDCFIAHFQAVKIHKTRAAFSLIAPSSSLIISSFFDFSNIIYCSKTFKI